LLAYVTSNYLCGAYMASADWLRTLLNQLFAPEMTSLPLITQDMWEMTIMPLISFFPLPFLFLSLFLFRNLFFFPVFNYMKLNSTSITLKFLKRFQLPMSNRITWNFPFPITWNWIQLPFPIEFLTHPVRKSRIQLPSVSNFRAWFFGRFCEF